ncbi:Fic family protein [Acidaminococcus timonensis]|uniref:Fic family protein n=1 Tax=Acidaminococcus timonensis TaxID=1871002 RepID=UPI00307BFAEC
MSYESLYKLYYKDTAVWEKTYQQRFSSPAACLLPFSVTQYNHKHGYQAFFCYNWELALLQEKISFDAGNCIRIIQEVPGAAISQFLHTCLIDEIKSTNDIEGVRSTRKEIIAAFSASESEKRALRLGSIVNKYVKIIEKQEIHLRTCQDIRDLFDDFLTDEIRRDDPKNLPDGTLFRKDPVDIVSGTQKVLHRGAYPEAEIIKQLDQALAILHDEGIPYLIRIALFHYLFGYIHPFYDGNGRMARFLTSYLLAQKFHPIIALQVSILIKKYRKKYYDLFSHTDAEINRGELTPFVVGTLQLIDQALCVTCDALENKKAQYDTILRIVKENQRLPLRNKTTLALCTLLLQATVFSDIGVSVKEIQEVLQVTENTVYTHLKKIPEEFLYIDKRMKPYRYCIKLESLEKD